MAAAENEAVVRRIFDAFARKDAFGLRGLFADDAVWHVPGHSIMAGTYEGREAIFRFLGRLPKETGGTYGSRLVDVLASDDRAAALYRAYGDRNGDRLDLDQLLLFRIDGGLIRRYWHYRPTLQSSRRSGRRVSTVSESRFADGVRYRIEIPSVEGPDVMRAVLDEAETRDIPVRRVSQGSGVMMLTDAEIAEMARLGAQHGVEVSLFLGPRGSWDPGGQSAATAAAGGVARGETGVEWCVAEARRGVGLGIRSFLVADLGVSRRSAPCAPPASYRRISCRRRPSCSPARTRRPRASSSGSERRRST